MEILSNISELSDERLVEYLAELRAAFEALLEVETPSADQVAEGESYADAIEAVTALQGERVTAAAEVAARAEALRTRFSAAEEDEDPEDEPDDPPADDPPADDAPAQAAAKPAKVKPASAATIAARVGRPQTPHDAEVPISITAAADVPNYATGAPLTMDDVGTALVARMRGFGTPTGNGATENLQHYGVASFKLDFPEDLTIDRHSDDMEVIAHAANEHRLPGGSLVAAGGWCSPSEQYYDLCAAETTEGMISVPETNWARGGIKFTKGPDFATIYSSVGFLQTETQAIAGTTKACFEVPCPSFSEVRLDAIGLCIKAPILTNATYPELIQRWLTGAMVAHQHKVNASVIARMVTIAGAARVVTGLGSAASDALEALELIADGRREAWRLPFTASLEVILPFWLKGVYRSDIGRRNGRDASAVTDAEIMAHFAVRHLAVQFVYDWQALTLTPEVYPATYQALMYPAGTFTKGTTDIINLNAVYDAASLATNIYTALFFEEGIAVANTCFDADLITLPICTAGRTGAANLTCA